MCLPAAALAALLPLHAATLDLERPEVRSFVEEVVERDHLERAWVERIVGAAATRTSIIAAMNRPAERVLQWPAYHRLFVSEQRIRDGRAFYAEHRVALEAAAAGSGVPPEMIAAIIGVETSYGRITGSYRVLDALATLAFDYPSRAAYFRGELEQFLLLSREAGFDPLTAMGSYAGAMGAPQFMPRSYRTFARDGDGDGRIDLWNDWPDIFASVAHYFVASGWHGGEPVVAAATLADPDVPELAASRLELSYTQDALERRGVLFASTLPDDARAMLVALWDGDAPRYWVGFHNFWVITRYNRSTMYALAASELAAAIGAGAPGEAPATAAGDGGGG